LPAAIILLQMNQPWAGGDSRTATRIVRCEMQPTFDRVRWKVNGDVGQQANVLRVTDLRRGSNEMRRGGGRISVFEQGFGLVPEGR